MSDDLLSVLDGRSWPDRTTLTVGELIRAIEAFIRFDHRLSFTLRCWGADWGKGEREWTVGGSLSVGNRDYISSSEMRALLDAIEAAGFYPFFSGGDEEGHVSIGIGSHEGRRTVSVEESFKAAMQAEQVE